jgi:hypothetical protein
MMLSSKKGMFVSISAQFILAMVAFASFRGSFGSSRINKLCHIVLTSSYVYISSSHKIYSNRCLFSWEYMKRMKGSGKHLSHSNLGTPNEIRTRKSLGLKLKRRENGVMIPTMQHIRLLHISPVMWNKIKTWTSTRGLQRRENGVTTLIVQRIPLVHTTTSERKTRSRPER